MKASTVDLVFVYTATNRFGHSIENYYSHAKWSDENQCHITDSFVQMTEHEVIEQLEVSARCSDVKLHIVEAEPYFAKKLNVGVIKNINEQRWNEFNNIMPPANWLMCQGVEIFMLSEQLSIYHRTFCCEYEGHYFEVIESISVPYSELAKRIRQQVSFLNLSLVA